MNDPFRKLSILAMLLPVMLASGGGRNAWAEDKPLTVFLCAGQSNMVGQRGVPEALKTELGALSDRVLIFDGAAWVPAATFQARQRTFGPELSFALAMTLALEEPIGIVKHSRGGTDLARDWNPERAESLYAALIEKTQEARASRPVSLAGMIWMQGERDSRSERMAQQYANNLEGLIRSLRSDLEAPGMKVVAGVVNPPQVRFPFVETVQNAQRTTRLEGYGFVSTEGVEKLADDLHYSPEGLVGLGRRFADRMLALPNPDDKAADCVLSLP